MKKYLPIFLLVSSSALAQPMSQVCAQYKQQVRQCYSHFAQESRSMSAQFAGIQDPYIRRMFQRNTLWRVDPHIACWRLEDVVFNLGC